MFVCKNPKKVKPTILGANPLAIGTNTPSPQNFFPTCGRRQIEHTELIVQGKPTRPGDWPWHVAVYSYDRQKTTKTYRCGGTLVSTRAVVTAAHCVTINGEKMASDLITVTIGKYSLKIQDVGSQEREILEFHVHEGFSVRTLRNDIAIMHLVTEVKYDQYIQPICLWPETDTSKDKIFGLQGIVVGWGLNENDTLSEELRAGNMTIATNEECLLSNANFFQRYVYDGSYCAGNGRFGGASACNGDSGGGMVIPIPQLDNKMSYFLRGIVSVSVSRANEAICNPEYYVVYTDAAKYLDWINKYK